MVNSHADRLVPGSNESMLTSARSNVSCTRSSARSTLPDKEMANARRLGTAARTASRIAGSSFIERCPVVSLFLVLFFETVQKFDETVGHALGDYVIIHVAQLPPDFA